MRKLLFVTTILFCGCARQTADEFYNRGIDKQNIGNFKEAIADYNEAIRIKPDYAIAYVARGICKIELGDYSGALADADSAIALNPDHAEAYDVRGNAKYELGNEYSAYMDWAKAAELGLQENGETVQNDSYDFTRLSDNDSYVTFSDSHGFSFDLPEYCENMTNNELGIALRKANSSLVFLAKVVFPSGNQLLSVSTYDAGEEIHIDSAFAETVSYVGTLMGATADDYKLVDYGTKGNDGKVLRYKISCIRDSIYSIMYYFMKDDYSRNFYEMKLVVSSQNDLKAGKYFLEKVALSVKYQNP